MRPEQEYYPDDMPPLPQQTLGPTSDAVYADYIQEKKVENILSQINPDNILSDIEARLKGFRKDALTKQWVLPTGTTQISPLLVSNFMSFLGSMLNNNTTLTNLKDHEINNIMKLVIEWCTDDLRSNAKIYGLEHNLTERTRIGLIICSTCFFTFKRAQNGLEAQRIFRTIKIGEHNSPMNEQQSGGALEALKFWK
jgi:hypothetical protein